MAYTYRRSGYKAQAGCIARGGVYLPQAKPLQMTMRAKPHDYVGALQVMLTYDAKAKVIPTLELWAGFNGALTMVDGATGIGKPKGKALDKAIRKAYGANTLGSFVGVAYDAKGTMKKSKVRAIVYGRASSSDKRSASTLESIRVKEKQERKY